MDELHVCIYRPNVFKEATSAYLLFSLKTESLPGFENQLFDASQSVRIRTDHYQSIPQVGSSQKLHQHDELERLLLQLGTGGGI